jgi:hypothetical protein
MRTVKATLIFVLALMLVTTAIGQEKKSCLFITAGDVLSGEWAPEDSVLIPTLESWELYNIDVAHIAGMLDWSSIDSTDALSYDFWFISESIGSNSAVFTKLLPIPIFSTEIFFVKPHVWGIGDGTGLEHGADSEGLVEMSQSDHYLTAGFEGEQFLVADSPAGKWIVSTNIYPLIEFIEVAVSPFEPDQVVCLGVEAGTELVDDIGEFAGDILPARRAIVGVHADSYEYLTEAAYLLIKAGMAWVAGDDETFVNNGRYVRPNQFRLAQNYPNPFNPTTHIEFSIPDPSMVRLAVFNMAGEKVSTLIHERKTAGRHTVAFDGSDLASGIYFYKLEAGDKMYVNKLTLMK